MSFLILLSLFGLTGLAEQEGPANLAVIPELAGLAKLWLEVLNYRCSGHAVGLMGK